MAHDSRLAEIHLQGMDLGAELELTFNVLEGHQR